MTRLPPFRAFALALVASCAATACSDQPAGKTEVTDLDKATTASEREAASEALQAADFADLQLGPKIVGPAGPQVEAKLSNEVGNFADMRSYVACPAGMQACDPKTAPAGTVYTYVYVVYPGEDNNASVGSGKGNDASDVERATMFRMTRPANGFTGTAGYSKGEAMAAVGQKVDVVMSCVDGALAWTISAGDGGDQWEQAEPITFWWQSTLPPAGPTDAFEIAVDGTTAHGLGPWPAAAKDAGDACLPDPAKAG
ncbi:MAG: hypothetical protein IE933_11740 [Sphingomonadales bacterium]|nr:hypothetical protein [Sphingomonadales bacterium]MBD3773273.1 hypothetical protein [Paracoccaceae bacterium]